MWLALWTTLAVLPASALFAQGALTHAPAGASATGQGRDSRGSQPAVSPNSPRASLVAYLVAARAGNYADASRYLDAPAAPGDAATLARELKLVLDRYAWFDLDDVSAAAAGDTTDELAPGVDQIAIIQTPDGASAPVRLRRFPAPPNSETSTIWRFSRATVEHIPAWYASLGNHWLIDRLPSALLRAGPFDLLWWQWLAALPLAAVAMLLGLAVGRIVRSMLGVVARRTSSTWDDELLARLAAPLSAVCGFIAVALLIPALSLYAPANAAAHRLVRVAVGAALFWAAWRVIDVARQALARSHWAAALPASRSLVPLGARTAKVVVAALGLVVMLSTLGYPVTSLLAGLGIGGLALALAAQKTVENLFGAFSIGIDQPFREGDFVKVDDFVGTVETIGLRSTRFRTLDRTIVTLPNGRLADMRLESFAVRDRLRLTTVIGLVYETTAEQMRDVLTGFERVLREHPLIWPDAVVVRFSELAASSLNIDVMAWFRTSDWGEFQRIRQDVLLRFMEVVEQAGTSFAFPTTTVHVAELPSFAGAEAS